MTTEDTLSLRDARVAQVPPMRQCAAARLIHVSRSALNRYEHGVNPCPSDTLGRLCALYRLSPAQQAALLRWCASITIPQIQE